MSQAPRTLVLGYGNPGRADDGLGPAFVAGLGALPPHVTVDSDYQLTVEDAAAIADHEVVLFVDASVDAAAPFTLTPLAPAADLSFSTHSVSAPAVLGLAGELFGNAPRAFVLAIRGYCFDPFVEMLTADGAANLAAALAAVRPHLLADNLEDLASDTAPRAGSVT